MGLIETRLTPNEPSDAGLPPASTYRLFQCHCCLSSVDLCSRCDRGNIYCSSCAQVRKAERIKRARSAYRKSGYGKTVRAAGEKRRRLRMQPAPDEGTVGDRGSPATEPQGNTSASGHVRPDGGIVPDEDPIFPAPEVVVLGLPSLPQGFVRCAHCHCLCEDFQIQGPRGRRFSRRPRSRSPPHAHTHRGGTP